MDEFVDSHPASDAEGELAGDLFAKLTELYPDWDMGDRTDLAMKMLAVVKRWAKRNGDFVDNNPLELPPGFRIR